MTNHVNPSSAAQDLAYIRRIVEETRRAVALNGNGFILWGFIVLLGLLGNYLLLSYRLPGWSSGALWGALIIAGWTLTGWWIRRHTREKHVRTSGGRLVGAVWIACTIAMIVICFAGIPSEVISPAAAGGSTAAVAGIGVFLTGILMDTRWVRNLAFGWWAGAVAQFIWHGEVQLLIAALIVVFFYIVPGFVLNARLRKQFAAARQ